MSSVPKQRMNVDEFLAWAEGRPGRYELERGEVVAMAPEMARHGEAKFATAKALERAIQKARAPCRVMPDGMAVRIAADIVYEPDALVYCGERLKPTQLEVPNPIIIVEVLSPSTGRIDRAKKLGGYFSVSSIEHYLIVDPDARTLIHHARGAGELIETRILHGGPFRLDPPGLDLAVEEFFPEE